MALVLHRKRSVTHQAGHKPPPETPQPWTERHAVWLVIAWPVAVLLLALVMLSSLPALAAEETDGTGYAGLTVSGVFPDSHRQTSDEWQIDALAGHHLNRLWNAEVDLSFGRLGDPTGQFYQVGASGGLRYYFRRTPTFSPFMRGMFGASLPLQSSMNGSKLFAELGTGFDHPLSHGPLQLRVDVVYRQSRDASLFSSGLPLADYRVGVGLVVSFGGKRKPPPTPKLPPPPAPPGDEDGDRVTDDLDLCPATPHGVAVNPAGCPADNDMDGVPDTVDLCLGTLLNATVDYRGCEPDTDQDGVINRLDRCPGTRIGVKVDEHGCPEVKVIRLEGVHFHFDSALLTEAAKTVLNGTAETLKHNNHILAEVAGHTDGRGSDNYNLLLSHRRALAVRNYLVMRGVPPAMLEARGYGETMPLSNNRTEKGRAHNRRVELRITTLDRSRVGR